MSLLITCKILILVNSIVLLKYFYLLQEFLDAIHKPATRYMIKSIIYWVYTVGIHTMSSYLLVEQPCSAFQHLLRAWKGTPQEAVAKVVAINI